MRRVRSVTASVLVLGLIMGAWADLALAQGQDISSAQAERYDGPKARIAVADFEDKMSSAGYYRAEYGRGMSDMLATALFNTNRYIVLEREKLQAVIAEQNLGASGRVRRETAAPIGEIEGAELLITAAITGFDPGVAGGGGGLGGLLGGAFGAIAGSFKRAHVAMDLRVVDTRTSRVVSATNVEGSATGFAGGGALIGGALGGALGGFAKTPMETAIREMIQKAVDFVVSKTPQTYYRHTAAGAPVPAPASAPAPAQGASAPGAGVQPGAESEAPQVAKTAPPDETGTPKARKVLQTIRAEGDQDLLVHLNEVTVRSAVMTVVVSLTYQGKAEKSQYFSLSRASNFVMDYNTGKTYPAITTSGVTAGTVGPGEVKVLRATFKAPENAKSVAITLSTLGTFDDVKLGE